MRELIATMQEFCNVPLKEEVLPSDLAHLMHVTPGMTTHVFWYDTATNRIDYSPNYEAHVESPVYSLWMKGERSWIRGRVGTYQGKVFCYVYSADFFMRRIPTQVIKDMTRALQKKIGMLIPMVVDDQGHLLEGKNDTRAA